jgi:hypothetical protein
MSESFDENLAMALVRSICTNFSQASKEDKQKAFEMAKNNNDVAFQFANGIGRFFVSLKGGDKKKIWAFAKTNSTFAEQLTSVLITMQFRALNNDDKETIFELSKENEEIANCLAQEFPLFFYSLKKKDRR